MFASAVCPNFYIQCERLFKPELRDQRLVIASQNSLGNSRIIACSEQGRAFGLIPGQQNTKLQELAIIHKFSVCEPNYELYSDLSTRFIKSLRLLTPTVSAYSEAEAFLNLKHLAVESPNQLNDDLTNRTPDQRYQSYAEDLQKTLRQWLGLSVLIGIAPTKTLAKLASNAAQSFTEYRGIIVISDPLERQAILRRIPVLDTPGVSKKVANKLSEINIQTALELSEAPKHQIRRRSSVIIERIAIELSGLRCKELSVNVNDQENASTMVDCIEAHTFIEISRALKRQVSKATSQLNNIACLSKAVTVSLIRAPLQTQSPSFQCLLSASLASATDSNMTIQQLAIQLLESLWHSGYQYHALQLSLEDLSSAKANQIGLFTNRTKHSGNNYVDQLPTTITIKTVLCKENARNWPQNRRFSTPSFTTRWTEIPRVS